MITSKVFALSLLLCSPLVLARVQLNSVVEVNHPLQDGKRTLTTEIQLATDESALICDSNNLRIETSVLSEQQDKATVQYSVYAENREGAYELIAAPVLCAAYGEPATVTFGQKSENGEKVDTLKITLNASKA